MTQARPAISLPPAALSSADLRAHAPHRLPGCPLAVPKWVDQWAGTTVAPLTPSGHSAFRITGEIRRGPRFAHVEVRVADADLMLDTTLAYATELAYDLVRQTLVAGAAAWPVRLWNFVPDIVAPAVGGMDRYMLFNAGRHRALSRWFGHDSATFARHMVAGTGVGHSGTDLVVHALADTAPGLAVENPRQTAAYRYSPHYGPLPPCFSRATLIRASSDMPDALATLLISGTSSVRGEDSVHVGDLTQQLEETFVNLAALIRVAGGADLRALQSLRVYHTQPGDGPTLRAQVLRRLPHLAEDAQQLEVLHAPLCRRNLDVEIEGVTQWPAVNQS